MAQHHATTGDSKPRRGFYRACRAGGVRRSERGGTARSRSCPGRAASARRSCYDRGAPSWESVHQLRQRPHLWSARLGHEWGLAEFAKFRPNILLKFIPQPADFIDSFAIQMAAGSQADVAMLGDGLLGTFAADGGYVQINDVIGKHPDWDVNNYYFCPDTYTANFDHNQAQGKLPPAVIEGPQFGAPFQGAVAGIVLNLTLGEQAGIEFPSEDWTYAGEFLESAKKATDPEKDLWGTWARQDFEFQWSEMALGYGANSVRNAEDTELSIFDNGGDQGLQFGTDLIHKQNVSFPVGDSKQLAGEFGNPFAAGTVWSWLSGRVYSHRICHSSDQGPIQVVARPAAERSHRQAGARVRGSAQPHHQWFGQEGHRRGGNGLHGVHERADVPDTGHD